MAMQSQSLPVTMHLVPRTPLPSAHEIGKQPVSRRKHLSRAEYAAKHGADPAHIAAVQQFAKANQLQVTDTNPVHRTVSVSGTIPNLEKAFKTKIQDVTVDGAQYKQNTAPITIPDNLKNIVTGVFGLDNRPIAKRHVSVPKSLPTSFTPPQVAGFYQFPQGTGKGQTVALIELGGWYSPAQLDAYWAKLGIAPAPNVSSVSVNGASNDPTPDNPTEAHESGEVQLDIEVVGSVAPGANIVVYFAPNTNQGFIAAVNAAIHDTANNPNIISISWGGAELGWSSQAMQTMDSSFQAAASLGISVFAAAGDSGSADGTSGTYVNFPASSPHCTACGGTSIQVSNGAITSEVVWNDGNGSATGGGVSDFFPLPSWQGNCNVPNSPNTNKPGRGVPDIAANADPKTGYQIQVNGASEVAGGTSAVAPLWAALTAIINESLGAAVGFWNPQLYGAVNSASALNPITEGNNITNNSTSQWLAGPGWNPCTGLGSPNGNAILAALKSNAG